MSEILDERQKADKKELSEAMEGFRLDVNDKESIRSIVEMGQLAQKILGRMW